MLDLSILLLCTILVLYLLRNHKLILFFMTMAVCLIAVIAWGIEGLDGLHWFGVVKIISIMGPVPLYAYSSWRQQSSSSSLNWLKIFSWVVCINVLEAAVYAFEILPHSFFIYSVGFFILISGLTVPRSKQWFYDDTFQCAAFSDLAWVLLMRVR
jgi:hypothetical protein